MKNNKVFLRVILIGIAAGICLGAVAGFIAGAFDLPFIVIFPAVSVVIAFFAILYLKKSLPK